MRHRVENGTRNRTGFTLSEMTIALAIIGILAAILFPVLTRTREHNQQAWCASNLRQLATAEMMYAQDYDGTIQVYYFSAPGVPTTPTWRDVLYPYTQNREIYSCPSRSERWTYNGNSFNWSLNATPKSRIQRPSRIVLFSDSDVDDTCGPEDDAIGWADDFHPAHSNMMRVHEGGANVCYADGHVRWINPATLVRLNFELS